jgi:hypothetical protein
MSNAIHERYFANDRAALQAAHMAIARALHALVGAMADDALQVRTGFKSLLERALPCAGVLEYGAALNWRQHSCPAVCCASLAAGASCAAAADVHAPLQSRRMREGSRGVPVLARRLPEPVCTLPNAPAWLRLRLHGPRRGARAAGTQKAIAGLRSLLPGAKPARTKQRLLCTRARRSSTITGWMRPLD